MADHHHLPNPPDDDLDALAETRAMRLILAIAADDTDSLAFTLRECRCPGCSAAVITVLASMSASLFNEHVPGWQTATLNEIAHRIKK